MNINTFSVFVVFKLSLELQNPIGNNDNTVCGCVFFYVIYTSKILGRNVDLAQATSSFSTLSETPVMRFCMGQFFATVFSVRCVRNFESARLLQVFAFQTIQSSSFRAQGSCGLFPLRFLNHSFVAYNGLKTFSLLLSLYAIYLSFLLSVSSSKLPYTCFLILSIAGNPSL